MPPYPEEPPTVYPYTGPSINELIPVMGYGSLTAGEIGFSSDVGNKKFFGVGGQSLRNVENKGFTLDDVNTRGTCVKTRLHP